ncbi:MAG: hypothetical protein BWZ10_03069 [candidate division BRC1 bacterium ADurb.BinA364]|nr:MAG: hypothetical protein BWZ10_03069 [candidate division BRC1 bacterium ADurb.BinA364]
MRLDDHAGRRRIDSRSRLAASLAGVSQALISAFCRHSLVFQRHFDARKRIAQRIGELLALPGLGADAAVHVFRPSDDKPRGIVEPDQFADFARHIAPGAPLGLDRRRGFGGAQSRGARHADSDRACVEGHQPGFKGIGIHAAASQALAAMDSRIIPRPRCSKLLPWPAPSCARDRLCNPSLRALAPLARRPVPDAPGDPRD